MLDLSICRLTGAHTSGGALSLLVPLTAACASEGIRRDTGIVSWLHWPNLVSIDDRIVAKASLAAERRGSRGTKITLGISVNCFAARGRAFPAGLPATSIRDALGVEIDIDFLRDKILHALTWYFAEWERGMNRKLVDRISSTISWMGRSVQVTTADGQLLRGEAKGLDDMGSLLLVEEGSGRERRARVLTPESVQLVRAGN